MNATTDFLRCPVCKGKLELGLPSIHNGSGEFILTCRPCSKEFISRNNILNFNPESDHERMSARMNFFRALNCAFYTPLTNFMFRFCGGADKARHEVLDRLEIRPGFKVLETGVGCGDNFPYLYKRAENLELFGLDNQYGMLRRCRSNMKKWKIKGELYLGDAEELPFRDHYFDVVFHLGAINLFRNKEKAIHEMIRVAKPGTPIIIADETEKAARYFEIFTGKMEKVVPPVGLIPGSAENIRLDTIWKGFGYLIEFMTCQDHQNINRVRTDKVSAQINMF